MAHYASSGALVYWKMMDAPSKSVDTGQHSRLSRLFGESYSVTVTVATIVTTRLVRLPEAGSLTTTAAECVWKL